jgi:TetR/AcrR family transcriptional regulator, cholesterol catabolism regulator
MPSGTEPKKVNRKKLITGKSAELFRNKGYSATSMRDIADAVGMEAASLYNHIKSKGDLLHDIIFSIANDCNKHLAEMKRAGKQPGEQVEELIRFHVQLMITRFAEYYVMTHDWGHLVGEQLQDFALQRRHYVQQLETIVAAGIANGEFKNIIPYVAVLNILSAVVGLEFWQRSQKRYTDSEMEENIVLHLMGGLKK